MTNALIIQSQHGNRKIVEQKHKDEKFQSKKGYKIRAQKSTLYHTLYHICEDSVDIVLPLRNIKGM